MAASPVSLLELADLAIGTPEVGAVNFTALHSLIVAMLKSLNLHETQIDFQSQAAEQLRYHGTPRPSASAPQLSASKERRRSVSRPSPQGLERQVEELGGQVQGLHKQLKTMEAQVEGVVWHVQNLTAAGLGPDLREWLGERTVTPTQGPEKAMTTLAPQKKLAPEGVSKKKLEKKPMTMPVPKRTSVTSEPSEKPETSLMSEKSETSLMSEKSVTSLMSETSQSGTLRAMKDGEKAEVSITQAMGLLQDIMQEVQLLKEAHQKEQELSELKPQKDLEKRVELLEKQNQERESFMNQVDRKLSLIPIGEDVTMVTWEELEQAITDGWKASQVTSETSTISPKRKGQGPLISADTSQSGVYTKHPSTDSTGGSAPAKTLSGSSTTGYPFERVSSRDRSRAPSAVGLPAREQHSRARDEAGTPRPHHPSASHFRTELDRLRSRDQYSTSHPRRDEREAHPGPAQQDPALPRDQLGVGYPDLQGRVYLSPDQVYPGQTQHGLGPPGTYAHGVAPPGMGHRGVVPPLVPGTDQQGVEPPRTDQHGMMLPSVEQQGMEQFGMDQYGLSPPFLDQSGLVPPALMQAGTDQRALVQPSLEAPGFIQQGTKQPDLAQPGADQRSLVPPGMVQRGLVPPGTVQRGLVPPGAVQQGLVPPGPDQRSLVPPGAVQRGLVPPGAVQRGLVPPGAVQHGLLPPGMDQHGLVQPGADQLGFVQPEADQYSLVQPGVDQHGLVQPGMDQHGLVQPGADQRGLVQPGADRYRLVQPGAEQPGLVQPGADQHGLVQPGAGQYSLIQPGADQRGLVQPGTDQRGLVQPGAGQYRLVQPGTEQPGLVQPGADQRGLVQPGLVGPGPDQHDLVQPGADQRRLVPPGTDQHGLVQPGAGQYSLIQPGADQRGLVQPGAGQYRLLQPGTEQPGLVQPGADQRGLVQPGLVGPGPDQHDLVQPGADQRRLVPPGTDQHGLVQPGAEQRGLVQPGTDQRGLVQPGADQYSLVQLGADQSGLVQPGVVQPGTDQRDLVQPGADQRRVEPPGADQHGLVQPGVVQPGTDQRDLVQPGADQRRLLPPGTDQRGFVQPGAVQHGLVQPSADQHGVAQPGLIQHGLVQPNAYPHGWMQPGAYPPSSVQPGTYPLGLVPPGVGQHALVQPVADQRGLVQHGADQHDLVQPGAYPPSSVQPGADQGGLVQPGTDQRGFVQPVAYPPTLGQPGAYPPRFAQLGAYPPSVMPPGTAQHGLVQPGAVRHGLAQPGVGQLGLVQPGMDQRSLVQSGADQYGLVQPGMDQHGLIQPGADQRGLVQPDAVQRGLVQPGADQSSLVQPGTDQRGLVQPGADQHGLGQRDVDQRGLVQPGADQSGLVQPGADQRGLVQPGVYVHGSVQPGAYPPGLVQPGAYPHGLMQLGADQHGLVPHGLDQQDSLPPGMKLHDFSPLQGDSLHLTSQQGVVPPGTDQYVRVPPLLTHPSLASPDLVLQRDQQYSFLPDQSDHAYPGPMYPGSRGPGYPGADGHGQINMAGASYQPGTHPDQDTTFIKRIASPSVLYQRSLESVEDSGEQQDSLEKLAPSFPMAVETFRLMGELIGLYTELKEHITDLEEEKAGLTDLEKIQYMIAVMVKKSIPPDFQEQMKTLKSLTKEVRQEKAKLDRMQRILEGEVMRDAGKEMRAGQLGLQLGVLRVTVADIEKELAELRESQEQGKVTMANSVSEASLYLQDQLDKLRTIIESMMTSSSTLLSLSMAPPKAPVTLTPGQIDPEATCPACSLDVSHQVSTLVQRYEHLQDMVNNLAASRPSKKARLQSQDEELLGHVQSAILQVQGDCEKLNITTSNLIKDHREKQKDIDVLYQGLERLDKEKANREHLEMEINVKADKSALAGKVSRVQFDTTTEQLNYMMQELLAKISGQEQDWQKMVDKLLLEMDSKLDRLELDPVKQLLEERWKSLRQQLKERSPLYQADEAAIMRRQLLVHFHCLSCDRPLETPVTGQITPVTPVSPCLPKHRSIRPYTIFELEQVRQQSRNLKVGSAFPRGDLGQLERSVGRLRTIHSRMLMDIEKVQLHFGGSVKASSQMIRELLQAQCLTSPCYKRVPDMPDYTYSSVPRSCGGSHTLTYPYRRNRLQHLPQGLYPSEEIQIAMKHDEVDILGLDGHIYKGRMDTRLPGILTKETQGLTKHKSKQSRLHVQRQQPMGDKGQVPSRPQSAQMTVGNNPAPSRQQKDRPVSSEGRLSRANLVHPPSPTAMEHLPAGSPVGLGLRVDVPPQEGVEEPTRGPRSTTAH